MLVGWYAKPETFNPKQQLLDLKPKPHRCVHSLHFEMMRSNTALCPTLEVTIDYFPSQGGLPIRFPLLLKSTEVPLLL